MGDLGHFEMTISNSKKSKKYETFAHSHFMSYSNEKKNINMVCIHLQEKGFTEMWYLEQSSRDFEGDDQIRVWHK